MGYKSTNISYKLNQSQLLSEIGSDRSQPKSGNDNTAEIPEYMTRNEAALLFKISLSTLHRNVKAGKLKIYKFGRRSLLKTSEVQNAVEEKLIIKYARRKEQR